MQTFTIDKNRANRRLDKVIKSLFPRMPLAAVYKNIRKNLKVNGKRASRDYILQENDLLKFYFDDRIVLEDEKQKRFYAKIKKSDFYKENLEIVFEDEDLLILNKASGIAMHPGSGHFKGDTLLDLAKAYFSDADYPPAPVHRLDIGTSGLVIFTKNNQATQKMSELIRERKIGKKYLALVHGRVKKDSGKIDLALSREMEGERVNKIHISKDNEDAKEALTFFKVIRRFSFLATLLELDIKTGRMHQIRVHLKSQNHPIWGDKNYASSEQFALARKMRLERIFLHSFRLEFDFGKRREFEAALPLKLEEFLERLGN
ncbi:MAG: RluA family pseudouridine synthase [Bacillota bacterium]